MENLEKNGLFTIEFCITTKIMIVKVNNICNVLLRNNLWNECFFPVVLKDFHSVVIEVC